MSPVRIRNEVFGFELAIALKTRSRLRGVLRQPEDHGQQKSAGTTRLTRRKRMHQQVVAPRQQHKTHARARTHTHLRR